ncbi:N-acetylmuramoyl-L-alanine amidase [Amycolatopsis pittospori]|uniref:N-acetylmuramoyl-L-alanine amidase n=1 Tax=Amycolatopsis pittospori TaxID=2749434 RepID=UPI0015F120A9|nr:peptidoglycan recognition family protein [Amycolatopsis pittospori]
MPRPFRPVVPEPLRRRSKRTAGLAVLTLAAGLLAAVPADAAPADQQRQRDFAAAAQEFGVPESVLLGVSFLESRWDFNAGTPSTSAGYGPMHLTDLREAGTGGTHHDEGEEDPRGDDARRAKAPAAPAPTTPPPGLQTIDEASALIGQDVATLRTNTTQNIRGGAALLAKYQREAGVRSEKAQDWYSSVARYSGAKDTAGAHAFADEVFDTMSKGVARKTDDGQNVTLAATPVSPVRAQADNPKTECPKTVSCLSVPAPYQELPNNDYGNHDKADRPKSQKVEYIVIHDTEGYWDTAMDLVTDPTYVSWHYTIRSADGQIAQHVPTKDVGWHAGNWYVNAKSVGIEHEGFAAKGTWYTEAMYRTSAKLVGYLARKYDIPLDRAHIIGHDNVPGTIPSTIKGMHWDPGPYWDWAHYFDLMGAPLSGFGRPGSPLVTITPDFATNQPAFTGCETAGKPCPARGSGSVVLRSEPTDSAPLLKDIGLRPDGSASTMAVSDIGSRAETGQRYVVAERRGGWTAIWYLGQKGWFRDSRTTSPAFGLVVTPKPGLETVPVFGRAYPEAEAYPANVPVQQVVPLPYTFSAGQRYSVGNVLGSEYYSATTFDPANHVVVKGKTRYVQIQFGHRIAFVKADDVRILPAF